MATDQALLRADGISKIYSQGALAVGLHRFSASFFRGEFVAITGSSGSGKSTLLNILSGLDSYDEGELYFKGEPTSHYTEEERAAYRKDNVAFIFQDYNIIDSYTVFQNIELALLYSIPDPAQRAERVAELIEAVGLDGHERQRCSKLSGGQKQRVSIARALAKDAPILFADEPCGNLDSAMTAEIMFLLHRLSKDKLVILVTHSFDEVASYATRKIRLADGELVEDQIINAVSLPLDEISSPVIDRKQEAKALLHVAFNNIKSTPKRSIFGMLGLMVMTVVFIISVLLSVTIIELPAYNNGHFRLDLQVEKSDRSAIDDYELMQLSLADGVAAAYRDNVMLNGYCSYTIDGQSIAVQMRPSCNFDANGLYSGRMPEALNEIVVNVPQTRSMLKKVSLDSLIRVTFGVKGNDGNLVTLEMKVVGVTLSDSGCAYFYPDLFAESAFYTVNGSRCIVVTTRNTADLELARKSIREMGYNVYHFYGDQVSQGTTSLINLLCPERLGHHRSDRRYNPLLW